MKKIILSTSFTKQLSPLLLASSIAFLSVYSGEILANPVNQTVTAQGTLLGIVDKNYPDSKLSKAQIMLAILANNPRAFKGGNVNFMLRNIELSLPAEDMIAGIPEQNAAVLLEQHNNFYRRGITGNLTPPTFINAGNTEAFEKLQSQHSEQTQRVEALSEESTKLQTLVQRLEAEKEKRDADLQALEDKIQALKESAANPEPDFGAIPGEVSASQQMLRDKNDALQQQLIETRSELAENNRTTITLERRMAEMQNKTEPEERNIGADQAFGSPEQEQNDTVMETETVEAPAVDLNGNVVNQEANKSSGFDFSKLTWLLPLLAILAGLGLLLKRFFGRKKHADLNLDEVDDFDFTTPQMSPEQRNANYMDDNGASSEPEAEEPLEVSIKLDVARAYMEAEDNQSAYEMLQEVLLEGSEEQCVEARRLLKKL